MGVDYSGVGGVGYYIPDDVVDTMADVWLDEYGYYMFPEPYTELNDTFTIDEAGSAAYGGELRVMAVIKNFEIGVTSLEDFEPLKRYLSKLFDLPGEPSIVLDCIVH